MLGRRCAAALIDVLLLGLVFVALGVTLGEAEASGGSVDVLPLLYLVGFVAVLATGGRRQRIGDLAARTAVVRTTPAHPRRPVLDDAEGAIGETSRCG